METLKKPACILRAHRRDRNSAGSHRGDCCAYADESDQGGTSLVAQRLKLMLVREIDPTCHN